MYVPLFHFLTISELKYAAVYCNGDFASFCTLGKAFGNVQNQGFLPTHFFNTSVVLSAVVAYLLLIVLPSKFCCGVFSATS